MLGLLSIFDVSFGIFETMSSILIVFPVVLLCLVFAQSPSFYAATILLSKTSFGQMTLFSFICSISYMIHKLILHLFFEPLRTVEKEHLKERAWIHITESIFALSMFRNGMSLPLALVAVGLFLLKSCFWVTIDRIDYIGQFNFDKGYYFRLSFFIVILNIVNYMVIDYAVQQTLTKLSPWIMFGFDHLLLWIEFFTFMFKYLFFLSEINHGSIEWKASFMKKVELCTEFLKFSSLVAFFSYITQFYGLPIYLLRDLYISGRSFLNKVKEYIAYRKATLDMDRRYRTATATDLEASSDITCIICREDLLANYEIHSQKPKILPCGHILHFICLLSWLERQQSCPIWYFLLT
eukprot:NODE_49_length_27162_cov_0.380039.p7 type:complete len:351 gc:universal NODE_49_length_27162_cov_0.380039:13536-14588(+)